MDKEFRIGKLFQMTIWKRFPCFEISFDKCGYFDGRPRINIALLFFHLVIHLPWINEKWTNECDPPKYGVSINENTLWIHLGGNGNLNGGNRWWTWDFPFLTMKFYKHYIMGKNGKWIDVTHKVNDIQKRKFFDTHIGYLYWGDNDLEADKKSLARIYYGKWTDRYDGKVIDAKYRIDLRIWRPKWLGWTSMFQKSRKSIDVCFKEEVGSQKGSWKGGVIGASNDFIKEDQGDPTLCFERMNREKNW